MQLPISRTENIVIQEANNELLIYDLLTNQAFCLNETSALVFNGCNGKTTIEELNQQTKLTDNIIFLALDELKNHNLLIGQYHSPFAGMSRREAVKKVGLSTMLALPVIMSIVAPVAAQANSQTCACPTTQPSPGNCQSRGQFTVGCVTSELDCQNIANTTTSCCDRVTGIAYLSDTQCCLLVCDPLTPGGG